MKYSEFSKLKMDTNITQMLKYLGLLQLLLASTLPGVQAQDDFGGGDDAGGGGEEMMDMESMGLDSGGGANKLSGQEGNNLPELTYIEQSTRALQQLALVIGVAFMVGVFFLVMVGCEKVCDKIEEKYKQTQGQNAQQELDPAALVGTFKRYK